LRSWFLAPSACFVYLQARTLLKVLLPTVADNTPEATIAGSRRKLFLLGLGGVQLVFAWFIARGGL